MGFLKDFFKWVFSYVLELVWPLVEGLIDVLPDFDFSIPAGVMSLYGFADNWFPVTEFIGLTFAWWMFLIAYAAVKFVKSWIPGVSG